MNVVLDEVAALLTLSADRQRTGRTAAEVVFRLADHLQQRGVLCRTQFSG
ncbi:TraY domain-containing protein [Candidatus Pantoea soli]